MNGELEPFNPYQPPGTSVLAGPSREDRLHAQDADRVTRLWGSLIDGVLIFLAILLVLALSGGVQGFFNSTLTPEGTLLFTASGPLLFLLIHGYPLATRGQTVGKMVVHTQIVSAQDGSLLPLWRLFLVRFLPVTLLAWAPFVGGFVPFVDGLLIFRSDHRCAHDHFAGTRVINYLPPLT